MTNRKSNPEKADANTHSDPVDPVPEFTRSPLMAGLLVAAAFAIIIAVTMYYGGVNWSESSAGLTANVEQQVGSSTGTQEPGTAQ